MSEENIFETLLQGVSEAMVNTQPGAEREWWQSFNFPETPNFCVKNLMNCARSALFGKALVGGPPVRETRWARSICDNNTLTVVFSVNRYITNELNGRLVYNLDSRNDKTGEFFYVFRGGAILATISSVNCEIHIVGTTEAHMQLGKDLLDSCIKGKDEQMEAEQA